MSNTNDTQKHTPGELVLTEVGTMGEYSIIVRPVPKDGGDIICKAPHGWESSMKRWRANAERIVQCWNEYDQLKERVKELEDAAIIDMAFNPLQAENKALKKQVEVLRGALEIAHRSIIGNDAFLSQPEWEKIESALSETKPVKTGIE